MAFQLQYGGAGLWYGQFEQFAAAGIAHGVSARFGGVSRAPFHSLDLALHVADSVEDVRENRRRFAAALGVDAARVVAAQQVHGERIARVGEDEAGRGAFSYEDALAETDALITDAPGLPLLLFYADCVPVLFADPVRRAVGVCHAGWRGTARRIAAKTLRAMGEAFGTRPEDCLIGIAPSIGACCYEVGAEVAEAFQAAFGADAGLLEARGDSWRLDLWRANRLQLLEAGARPDRIDCAGVCTACNHEVFFSYRADAGQTGRIGALVALTPR